MAFRLEITLKSYSCCLLYKQHTLCLNIKISLLLKNILTFIKINCRITKVRVPQKS